MRFEGTLSCVTPDGRFGIVEIDGFADGSGLAVIGPDTKGRLALMSACGGPLAKGARVSGIAVRAGDAYRAAEISGFLPQPHSPPSRRKGFRSRLRAAFAAVALTAVPFYALAGDGPSRVIVTLDASLLPDPASYENSPEGDRRRTADVRMLQEAVITRTFSPDGSPVQLPESYGLVLMDFTPQFAIAAGSHEIGRLMADPAVSGVQEDGVSAPFR